MEQQIEKINRALADFVSRIDAWQEKFAIELTARALWRAGSGKYLQEVVPPPEGVVCINKNGAVITSAETLKKLDSEKHEVRFVDCAWR